MSVSPRILTYPWLLESLAVDSLEGRSRRKVLIGSISGVSGRLDSPVVALFPCVSDASEESNEASDMADQLGRARSLRERREECSDFLDGVRCLVGD